MTLKEILQRLFRELLPLLEKGADDHRMAVRKAVSWPLRKIGARNTTLHAEARTVAQKLSGSESKGARWVARDVLKALDK